MRLLASCADSGSLKEIICNRGTDTSKRTTLHPFYVGTSLSEGANSAIDKMASIDAEHMLLARNNGCLEFVKLTRHRREPIQDNQTSAKESTEQSLYEFEISKFENLGVIEGLTDDSRMEPLYAKSKKRVKLRDGFVALQLLPNMLDTCLAATKSGFIHIIRIDVQKGEISKVNTLTVVAPLEFAQLNDIGEGLFDGKFLFAYGGEENLVKLVAMEADFSKLTQIWEAKNVKNDILDLRVPVWPVGLKFIKPFRSSEAANEKCNFQFVTITHWSHLGLYRTQHGRKPLAYKELLPNREPLVHLEIVGDDRTALGNLNVEEFEDFSFITADTKHNVFKFNIDGRLISKFGKSDMTGASTCIAISKHKYMLQSGLDRYARVYDLSTSERLAKVYLGSRSSCLELIDDTELVSSQDLNKRKIDSEEEEQDADVMWDQLESTSHKKNKHHK